MLMYYTTILICKIDFRGGEPPRWIYDYPAIKMNTLETRLLKSHHSFHVVNNSLPNCSYVSIVEGNANFKEAICKDYARNKSTVHWHPFHCNPTLSSAIIVPYRRRMEQLSIFANYMHTFLRRQNLYFKIFIADQIDDFGFNRGALMNVGARQAIAEGFECLIFHDVDLLPLNIANLYACLDSPRHMSAAIDTFRNLLPYEAIMGGAVAMSTKQYLQVNGHSNLYYNWGCEDDDLYRRLQFQHLDLIRFPNEVSRYHMQKHEGQTRNADRLKIYYQNEGHYLEEGLNSLNCRILEVKEHWLYQHILVKLIKSNN